MASQVFCFFPASHDGRIRAVMTHPPRSSIPGRGLRVQRPLSRGGRLTCRPGLNLRSIPTSKPPCEAIWSSCGRRTIRQVRVEPRSRPNILRWLPSVLDRLRQLPDGCRFENFSAHPGPTKTPLNERRFFTTGAAGRNRTGDLRITNALLYQLSYNGEKQRAL